MQQIAIKKIKKTKETMIMSVNNITTSDVNKFPELSSVLANVVGANESAPESCEVCRVIEILGRSGIIYWLTIGPSVEASYDSVGKTLVVAL